MERKNKLTFFSILSIITIVLVILFQTGKTKLPRFAEYKPFQCNDIVFGTNVVGTGSSKDMDGTYYSITDWTNAKHTDTYAAVIGGTTDGKREGSFVVNIKGYTCVRAIVYATGYSGDAKSNIYLAVNESEQKVANTATDAEYVFGSYTYENINNSTLTFRNVLGNKKGRVCISKIVFRLTNTN